MLETEILQQRLTTATALSAVLDVSWDIFDFIQQVASEFSGPDGEWAFTQAAAAALRGRYALSAARSLPGDTSSDGLPMCVFNDQDHAAHVLARLAGLVGHRLTRACGQTSDRDDQRACGVGAGAAAEAHALLLTAGGGA